MKVRGRLNCWEGNGELDLRVREDRVVVSITLDTDSGFSTDRFELQLSAEDAENLADQLVAHSFDARENEEKMTPVAGTTSVARNGW